MDDDKIIVQNTLTFMDKVSATGRNEVAAYVECVKWLEAKLQPEMKVEEKKAK